LQIVDALCDVSQSLAETKSAPGEECSRPAPPSARQRLIAIELDRVPPRRFDSTRFGPKLVPHVEVIEADILSVDIDSLFGRSGPIPACVRPGIEFKPSPVKVIGIFLYINSDNPAAVVLN